MKNKNNINILSLDGGGVRGLIQLQTLESIHLPHDYFDFIVGTSIGGIIAIAMNFFTVQEIQFLIEKNCEKIFKESFCDKIESANGWLKSSKNSKDFCEVLTEIFQNIGFKQCFLNTLAVSWDLKNKKPKIFKSYQDDMLCSDVAYSTAAAPTYFMPKKYFDKEYIDGGVFFNNPSIIAAQEAKLLYPDKKINLLSIGTGKNTQNFTIKKGGKLEWAEHIVDLMIEAGTEGIDFIVKNTYPEINYLRLQIDLNENIKLDDYTKTNKLKEYGKNMYYQNVKKIEDWIQKGVM